MKLCIHKQIHALLLATLLGIGMGFSSSSAWAVESQSRNVLILSMSLDQAVSMIADRTGGRVLKAHRQGSVYVIKVLMPSGVVKTFRVSANGG